MSSMVKPFTTIDDQIAILRGRGMIIDDEDFARRWLASVGYYRLSGYWHTSRKIQGFEVDGNRKIPIRADEYQDCTNFSDIARLYELDRKLRTLAHDGIERLEVALRTAIAHNLAEVDPLALYDRSLFRDMSDRTAGLYHYDLISQITGRISRAANRGRGDAYTTHNIEKYGPQLPTWVIMDVLDFSDVSKIFGALKTDYQIPIAKCLGFDTNQITLSKVQWKEVRRNHTLTPWLRQLTLLRNKSAHHSRVWNATLAPAGTKVIEQYEGMSALPANQSERIYGCMTFLAKVLETTSPSSSWPEKVKQLLLFGFSSVPQFTTEAVGAVEGWSNKGLWANY